MLTSRKICYILPLTILFLFIQSLPLSGDTAPVWSYQIQGITSAAMSEEGLYMIVGTDQGYFYIFDQYGNVIKTDFAGAAINTIAVSDNGTHFIGTQLGYYISTLYGTPQIIVSRNAQFLSVATSKTAKTIIAGTGKQIYLFQDFNLLHEQYFYDVNEEFKEKNEIKFTDINSLGDVAIAASMDVIALFSRASGEWQFISCDQYVSSLAISKHGSTFGWGTEDGEIRIFNEMYPDNYTTLFRGNEEIHQIAFTENGKYLFGCTPSGDLSFMTTDGEILWEVHLMKTVHSISQAGNLIAVAGERLQLLNTSGTMLFDISLSNQLAYVRLSQNGQYIFCASQNTIFFHNLFPSVLRSTQELDYASRRNYPHADLLVENNLCCDILNPQKILEGDVNGDGKKEFIMGLEKKVLITDTSGTILLEIPLDRDTQVCNVLDVTGDFVPEIIASSIHTLDLTIYDGEGILLAHHNFAQVWELLPDHKGIITPLMATNIDDDDDLEVISVVSAGYSLVPRGIFVFEFPSFSTEWFYAHAPQVESTTIVDFDNDSAIEILIGSNNPCNMSDSTEENDCIASVVALSSRGEKLWSQEVGFGFRRTIVDCADLDGDGNLEIVCSGWTFEDTWGSLFILDTQGKYIRGENNEFDHSIFLRNIVDLDDDGKKELITFSRGGYVVIFDHMLNRIHEKKLDMKTGKYTRSIVNDIDADSKKEIIVSSNDDVIYILNGDLTIEQIIFLPTSLKYGHCTITNLGGCKNNLIIIGDRIYGFSYPNDTTHGSCPLWERTERILRQEGTGYEEEGIRLFSSGKYRESLDYLVKARENFIKLEDEESISQLTETIIIASEHIFKENILFILIAFAVFDGIIFSVLIYVRIVNRHWITLGEWAVVLTLPIVFGLVNVYHAQDDYVYVFTMYCFPSYVGSSIIVLRDQITGFMRTLASILSGHKDMLVLSIIKSHESYRVSIESIEERFLPVKESRIISFPTQAKADLLEKINFMVDALNYYSTSAESVSTRTMPVDTLETCGAAIYSGFIPQEFSELLNTKFLLLEMEDTEIPWELMYADTFFSLQYAISRRIVTTESVNVRKKPVSEKRALIICDPTDSLKNARKECDILEKKLRRKMNVVYLHGKKITRVSLAHHLSLGFDIIHFAGHIDAGIVVSDGTLTYDEVKECMVGTPVIFMNGCKSEELARSFLIGGALAYVGMIHPVHDRWAAQIALDFYTYCFQYRVGEALRRARVDNMKNSIVWASLIMYGDPTMKLF